MENSTCLLLKLLPFVYFGQVGKGKKPENTESTDIDGAQEESVA